jgi:signal recognition particle receptor subunit beta
VAYLDREREVIVIRVVYDGPPEAGKTTSLRALAGSLGQRLESPAEEYGRTLFFDWMDYTAGRFEGYQIRCQIVSVPGQRELTPRRFRLVKDADVVVFVGDSAQARVVESLEYLRDVSRFLNRTATPPVGIIFQANKRDLPSAIPIDELRKLVHSGGNNIGVVESVAADGTGIRETFVFAVRLALDRVREQLQTHTLAVAKPEIDSSDALMEHLRSRESTHFDDTVAAHPLLRQVLAENADSVVASAPWHDVSVASAERVDLAARRRPHDLGGSGVDAHDHASPPQRRLDGGPRSRLAHLLGRRHRVRRSRGRTRDAGARRALARRVQTAPVGAPLHRAREHRTGHVAALADRSRRATAAQSLPRHRPLFDRRGGGAHHRSRDVIV